ncbi:MAG TPA: bifunctional diguanylate cyclase/phosphodiesterase, partial [Rhodospirillales bacterium]|nr:bifunctional diguanylate cyclase/phosphodiesterase [Rhodospirillales bacterium]
MRKSDEAGTRPDVVRIWIALGLVIILIIAAAMMLVEADTQRDQQEQVASVISKLSTVRARLEGAINGNLLAITGLIVEISMNPEITQEEFSRYASVILAQKTEIRHVSAARNLVISHIYPLAGNKKALGLDYRQVKKQADAALRARDIGGIFVAGPINLGQGGRGFVARTPIYEFSESGVANQGRFWGLLSVVIDVDKLYGVAGLTSSNQTIEIAIRGQDSSGSDGAVFFGRPALFDSDRALLDVSLPHGSWQLAAA